MWLVVLLAVLVAPCDGQVRYLVGGIEVVVAETPAVVYVGGNPVRLINSSTPVLTCNSVVWMDYGLTNNWVRVVYGQSAVVLYTGIVAHAIACGNGVGGNTTLSRMMQGLNTTAFLDVAMAPGQCVNEAYLDSITQVVVGTSHACALHSSGAVYCWGSNARCQFGTGPASTDVVYEPVRYSWFSDFQYLTSNKDITCGIRPSDTVVCWGMFQGIPNPAYGTDCAEYTVARFGYSAPRPNFPVGVWSIGITSTSIGLWGPDGFHYTSIAAEWLPATPVIVATDPDYSVLLGFDERWSAYPVYFFSDGETVLLGHGDDGFAMLLYDGGGGIGILPGCLPEETDDGFGGGVHEPYVYVQRGYLGSLATAGRVCDDGGADFGLSGTVGAQGCYNTVCEDVDIVGISSLDTLYQVYKCVFAGTSHIQVCAFDMYATTQRVLFAGRWTTAGNFSNFSDFGTGGGLGVVQPFLQTGRFGLTRGPTGACAQTLYGYECNVNGVHSGYPTADLAMGGAGICYLLGGNAECNGGVLSIAGIPRVAAPQSAFSGTNGARFGRSGGLLSQGSCTAFVNSNASCYSAVNVYDLATGAQVYYGSGGSMPQQIQLSCNGSAVCMRVGGCFGGSWRTNAQTFTLGTVVQTSAGNLHSCVLLANGTVVCVGNTARCAYLLPVGVGYDTTTWNAVVGGPYTGVYSGGSTTCLTTASGLVCSGTSLAWRWCSGNVFAPLASNGTTVVGVSIGPTALCYTERNAVQGSYRIWCAGINSDNFLGTQGSATAFSIGLMSWSNGSAVTCRRMPAVTVGSSRLSVVCENATIIGGQAEIFVSDQTVVETLQTQDTGVVYGNVTNTFWNSETGQCALVNGGLRIFCLGVNLYGQNGYIGNGHDVVWFLDMDVVGDVFVGGAIGGGHVILRTRSNGLYCAGLNTYGQCGHRYKNVTAQIQFVPMDVSYWGWPYVTPATTTVAPTVVDTAHGDTDDEVDVNVDGIGVGGGTAGSGLNTSWRVAAVALGVVATICVIFLFFLVVKVVHRFRNPQVD